MIDQVGLVVGGRLAAGGGRRALPWEIGEDEACHSDRSRLNLYPVLFVAAMNRPPAPVRPFLGATAGLVLCAGVAAAAPQPAEALPAEQAKPGWMSRLSATPKKLAFWNEDKTPAPAPAPASPAGVAKPGSATKPAAVAKPGSSAKPAAAAKPGSATKPAGVAKPGSAAKPEVPSVGAAVTTKKKSFLTRLPSLPSLPFLGKPAVVEAGVLSEGESSEGGRVTEAAMGRRGEGGSHSRGGASPAVEAEAKRPGILSWARNGLFDRKEVAGAGVPAVAGGAAVAGEVRKDKATTAVVSPPAAGVEVSAEKSSWWERMTSAVTPGLGGGAKPQIAAVPKGAGLMGSTVPSSDTFVITKDDSAFYSFGPHQATPPDAYLSTGTVVTMTAKSWGWATVMLPDGRTGIVDRGALRQASVHDLIPSRRLGDGASSLMAALSPDQLKQQSMPSFILPPAEMPDLPSNAETTAAAAADAEALSASLLPPFGFDGAGGRAGLEPAVEETVSTGESAGEAGEAGEAATEAPQEPAPAAPGESGAETAPVPLPEDSSTH
jgi:hypothetical protein